MFLKPINDTLFMAGGRVQNASILNIQRTKYLTLAGVVLTVGSSTVFYLSIFFTPLYKMGFILQYPWTNPLVFGANMDSVLNDFGMLMMSGIPKRILSLSLRDIMASMFSKRQTVSIAPTPVCIIDSQAYEKEDRKARAEPMAGSGRK